MEDIDAVYLWVDGSDPKHIALRRKYAGQHATKHDGANRWADHDELKYSLRSLATFAPWIRTVHIVTNGQVPVWMNTDNPRVRLVTHQQIYKWPQHLPTFNSRSIETHLHRIPDLAERFLYFNDDNFLGAPCTPDTFFTDDGKIRVTLQRRRLNDPNGWASVLRGAKLLRELQPGTVFYRQGHQVKPYTLTLLQRAASQWPRVAFANSAARFRNEDGVSMCQAVFGNYAIALGIAVPTSIPRMVLRGSCNATYNRRLMRNLLRRQPTLFCINDNCLSGNVGPEIQQGLERYFPNPSEYENGN